MKETHPEPKKMLDESEQIYHGVCRDCPDEWVGDAQEVHRDAEIHALAHGHRTEVQEVAR